MLDVNDVRLYFGNNWLVLLTPGVDGVEFEGKGICVKVAFGVDDPGGHVTFSDDADALTIGICGLVTFADDKGADELPDGLVSLGINDDEERVEFEDDEEEEDWVFPALEDSAFPNG